MITSLFVLNMYRLVAIPQHFFKHGSSTVVFSLTSLNNSEVPNSEILILGDGKKKVLWLEIEPSVKPE